MTRSFLRAALALAVAAGAAGGAHAAGAYAGGALSVPDYNSSIDGVGGDGGGHGVGGKLYGGYQFTPNFALEGGYMNLGHSKDRGGEARGQGVYVDGVASMAFAPQWSVFGSLGLAEARLKTPYGDDSSPALKLGLGVEYQLTKTAALRVGYDRYHFTDAFDGKPNVGQAVAGVQFAF